MFDWFKTCKLWNPPTDAAHLASFVEERHPGCMAMASGRLFSVIDPQPSEINIGEIAHHLAQVNRFGGACRWPYSVAQHARNCAYECMRRYPQRYDLAFACLHHDDAEAYCGDVIRTVKQLISHCYSPIERRIQAAVWRRYGIDHSPDVARVVKEIDLAVLRSEAQQLVPGSHSWDWRGIKPGNADVRERDWKEARNQFLDDFGFLWYAIHEDLEFPEHEIWRSDRVIRDTIDACLTSS